MDGLYLYYYHYYFFAFPITRSPDHPILIACQSALILRKSAANFGCGSAALCSTCDLVLFPL